MNDMHWRPLHPLFVLSLVVNTYQTGFAPLLRPKPGQRMLYKQQFRCTVNGLKIERSGVLEVRYAVVQNDRIQSECTSTIDRLVVDGEKITLNDSATYTKTSAANGNTEEVKSQDLDSTALRLLALSSFEPGTVPSVESKSNRQFKTAKFRPVPLSQEYLVLGSERALGVLCKKFSLTAKETSGKNPMTCQSTVWINSNDGTLCKTIGTYQNVPLDSDEPGAYSMEFEVEWVP